MRCLKNSLHTVLPALCIALVFTLAPVDNRYTAGIIGAEPVCAQDPGAILNCVMAWRDMVDTMQRWCPAGTTAHCDVSCDFDTGEIGYASCICVQ